MAFNYRVFISHSWSYHDALINLRNLLNKRPCFNVEFQEASADVPINSESAPYVKRILRKRIEQSNVVLVIAGLYATRSEWMQFELEAATDFGIPIVCVVPFGQKKVSVVAKAYSSDIVRWNTESIVEAIRKNATK